MPKKKGKGGGKKGGGGAVAAQAEAPDVTEKESEEGATAEPTKGAALPEEPLGPLATAAGLEISVGRGKGKKARGRGRELATAQRGQGDVTLPAPPGFVTPTPKPELPAPIEFGDVPQQKKSKEKGPPPGFVTEQIKSPQVEQLSGSRMQAFPELGEPSVSMGRGRGSQGRGRPSPMREQTQVPGFPPAQIRPEPQVAQAIRMPPQAGLQPPGKQVSETRPSQKEISLAPLAQKLPIIEGEGLMPPRRRDFGTVGRPIKLAVNHFEVKFNPKGKIYHFDVEIKPEIKAMKGLKRNIIESMVKNFPKIFGQVKCVFDGEKNMYTNNKLPIERDGIPLDVVLPKENPAERKEKRFNVTIKQVAEISLADLQYFLDGRSRTVPQHAIQALDIVFRHLPTLRYINIGRSIFPVVDKGQDLEGGVELWRGYYQSIRPGEWKQLQLNLDVSNRTFYKNQGVLQFAAEFLRCRSVEDLKNCKRQDWMAFDKEIKGLQVRATHTGIPRKYKIIGLSQQPAAMQKFPLTLESGETVDCTVAKFFNEKHKKPLKYHQLPCLQAQPAEKHRYLPMEVCEIPVGQQCKKLSDFQTANMIKKTAVAAPQRKSDVQQLIRNARLNQDEYVRGFGLSVSDTLMSIDGRILPPPKLNLKSFSVEPFNGVWDMRQRQFFNGAQIHDWGVITVNARTQPDQVTRFCRDMQRIAGDIGMHINQPKFSEIITQRDVPEELFRSIKSKYPQLKLIIVVLPGKTPAYADIKRMGDTQYGIITQCVQSKNVEKSNPATLTNILMKINAKLGGINSILQPETRSTVFKKPVIFLGADVTHPPAGDKTKPSIAAIVGSMDMNAQVYAAKVCVQEHRVEIITDLKNQTRELLLEFNRKLNAKPVKIIFYRDGVGEGQFYEVLRHELTAIRAACSSLHPDYKPAVTFLVVQKRHHTRLFCEDSRQAIGRSANVPPGTTVDKAITHPIENDFFLCSHQGIQGTSRPTHYHVLWDDSDFSANDLQQLTYQLCHTYVRCTRSVSIPAPAYYAHLVAFRARYHLEKLQGRVDQEKGDPSIWLKKMQAAVQIHDSTGTMYYV